MEDLKCRSTEINDWNGLLYEKIGWLLKTAKKIKNFVFEWPMDDFSDRDQQCWGSVTLRMQIKLFFHIFFFITYPQAHDIQSKKFNVLLLLKFSCNILFCKHYFSPLNTFMRKGKDPDPYGTVPLTNGYGSGKPRNTWISNTGVQLTDIGFCCW